MKKRIRRKREDKKDKKKKIKVWNRTMDYMYINRVGKICVLNFCIEFFGLVVVLNGRKFCIEKMLGLTEDAVKNFPKPIFLCWS